MKRPAVFHLVTVATFAAWTAGKCQENNLIADICESDGRLSRSLDWLAGCCLKQYKKHGGLDLDYLADSSTLKSITRQARQKTAVYGRGAWFSMAEDLKARQYLAAGIFQRCAAGLA